jgi:hypothetical protein
VVQTAIDDDRYGPGTTRSELLRRSVAEGAPNAVYAAAAQVRGAGHFACLEGYDGLGSSGHLEVGASDVDPAHRELIGALTVAFARAAFSGEYEPVDEALRSPGVLRVDGR